MTTRRPLPRRLLVTFAVVAGSAGLAAGVTSAASPDGAAAPPTTVSAPTEPSQTEPPTTAPGLLDEEVTCETVFEAGTEAEFDQFFSGLDETDKAALTEQMAADAAAQKEALDAAGVEYEMIVDPSTGIEWPGVAADDAAADEVLTSFVSTSSAFEIGDSSITISAGGEEDFETYFASLDETEKADLVAGMTEMSNDIAAELDAEGVEYTSEVDPLTGVEWPMPADGEWTDGEWAEGEAPFIEIGEDDCVDGEIITEEISDADFEDFLNSLSPEERTELVDQMAADAAEFKKQLDDAGVAYTLSVDPATGVEWPCPGDSVDGESGDGTTFEYELGEPISPDSDVTAEPGQ